MTATRSRGFWKASLVRPAGGGDRRRPADVVRLVLGTLGAAALFSISLRLPASDRGLTAWLKDLGVDLHWLGTLAETLLLVITPVFVVLVGLTTRSWRLLLSAITALASGFLVVAATALLTQPGADRQAQLDALGINGHFPLYTVAVPVAVLAASGAFLARPARRVLAVVVAVGIVAFTLAEQALLLDVLASAFAGWAAAGLAGLLFGAPVGDATPDSVVTNLADLGIEATSARAIGHPVWGTARYVASQDGTGDVLVDVHGREAEDARLIQRFWHGLVDKDAVRTVSVTRREQAEHEALCLGLARRAAVPVPDLISVGAVGPSEDGYVVVRANEGTTLRDCEPAAVTDDVLHAVWRAVDACHRAGLAHNLLDGAAIEVCADGTVQLTDWFLAATAADEAARNRDVATTLLTTAAKTDASRAVAAAMTVMGSEAIAGALPYCQLGVLDRRARHEVDKKLAADVRNVAADALGQESPELAELHRVSISDLLMIGGSLLGFWLLYSELTSFDDLWSTLATADWAWVTITVVLAQVSVVCIAIALRGAVMQQLSLGRVIMLEYADLFTGLVGGTVAITATNIRFFQRQGLPGATAVTAGVVSSLSGGVIQAIIIIVSLPFLLSSGRLHVDRSGGGGGGTTLIAIIVGVALVSGLVMLVPRFRSTVARRVRPHLDTAWEDVRELARKPSKIVTMFGGQLASQFALAIALGAALHAYGDSLPFIELLLINTFAALIGGLAPVPGGMGAVEAGLIGGFTAFGIDATVAGAATFTYRLFTAYLPPAWGWPTLAAMRKRELL